MMQKTNFPVEVLIHDDASTDNTADIIREYETKYPNIIKTVYQKENQYSKGINPAVEYLFPLVQGKYIALCEGDDYWTDPLKLQKQVDFLEANPDFSLTCHRYTVLNGTTNEKTDDYVAEVFKKNNNPEKIVFNVQDNFNIWFTKTMTVVFRNEKDLVDILSKYTLVRDVHLFYHILEDKKGCCFNFNGAVYRIHQGGIWGTKNTVEKLYTSLKVLEELYDFNKNDISLKNQCKQSLKNFKAEIHSGFISAKYPFFYFRRVKNYIKLYSVYAKQSLFKTIIFYPVFFVFYMVKRLLSKFSRLIVKMLSLS
jgi:glycosyltransferase involved in cell wall biosynthesis